MITRDVFLYLISSWADDEGRFRADAFTIADQAFSNKHDVSEEDVAGALDALATGNLIVVYGNGHKYGHLTGWYEHQYIQGSRREPSNLPQPPVAVPSWEHADAIRAVYREDQNYTEKATVTYRDAIRWFVGRYQADNGSLPDWYRDDNGALSFRSPEVEVKGKEGKGSNNNDSMSEPDGSAPEIDSQLAEKQAELAELNEKLEKKRELRDTQNEIDELRDGLDDQYISVLDRYLDCSCAANKSEKIAKSKERRLTAEFIDLIEETEAPVGAMRYAIGQMEKAEERQDVDKRSGPNVRYMKKAIASYDPQKPMIQQEDGIPGYDY